MRAADDHAVVLSGRGAVTPLGASRATTVAALTAGQTGVRQDNVAPAGSGLEWTALAAEPYLRVALPRALEAQVKFLNGAGRLAVEAASEAWTSACIGEHASDGERQGLWLSQMDAQDWACYELRAGFAEATEHFARAASGETLNREIARRTKPFFLLESLKNNAFSFLANLFDLRGANTAVAGWAGPTLHALDFAARALRRGDLDRALVVGAGRAAHPVARADLLRLGLRRPGGEGGYLPFDRDGRGPVLGEAAAAVVLERWADAASRGTPAHPRLVAVSGATADPMPDLPAPRAATYRAALEAALDEAQVDAGEVGLVVLPAFGLPEADGEVLEGARTPRLAGALRVAWRGALGLVPLASDLTDLVLAAEALASGRAPGTVGLDTPMEGAADVAREPFRVTAPGAVVLTAGFHGDASAAVLTL